MTGRGSAPRTPPPSRSGIYFGLALRLAAKGLIRSSGSTLLAAAVLTLGLATPTTFFSLLVGAIRPLPVQEGDRVVRVDVVQPARDGRALPLLLEDLRGLQRAGNLESLGGYRTFQGTLMDPGRAAARLSAAELTRRRRSPWPELFA